MEPNYGKEYLRQYGQPQGYPPEYAQYAPPDFAQFSGPPKPPGMSLVPSSQMAVNPYMDQPQAQYPIPSQSEVPAAKTKGKRRSKNETEGRTHKCTQCDRTYLSYPALYTHIKTKHSKEGEAPLLSGRGRGRPKKNVCECHE